jgi:hypothetical protein
VTREHFLFIAVSAVMPLVGWGIVYVSSRIERERRERHAERFGEQPPASRPRSQWMCLMRRWRQTGRPLSEP